MKPADSSCGVNYFIPISNGILTAEHCKRLGGMTPFYLYAAYINLTTSEKTIPDWTGKVGIVGRGKPLPDAEIAKQFDQLPSRVRRCRRVLLRQLYILQKDTPAGPIIYVNKSKKWGWGSGGQLPEVRSNLTGGPAEIYRRSGRQRPDNSEQAANEAEAAAETGAAAVAWKEVGIAPCGRREFQALFLGRIAKRNGHSLTELMAQTLDEWDLIRGSHPRPAPFCAALEDLRRRERSGVESDSRIPTVGYIVPLER